jgi:hypothetical protein
MENKETIFKDNKYISRDGFRQWLRGRELFYSTQMTELERIQFEEELNKSYGHYFEKEEVKRIVKDMESKRNKMMDMAERKKIEKKINLLKIFLNS